MMSAARVKTGSLLVVCLFVLLCVVVKYRIMDNGTTTQPSVRSVRPMISQSEISRIRAIPDRTDRMKAILDSLPPERTWPDVLPFGFKWNKTPDNSKQITPDMPAADAENAFFKFLESYPINCPVQERFGNAKGGGWDVCIAGPFNFSRPCLVYSVGMGGEWSFDSVVMDKRGCADMAFDPTLGKTNHKPYPLMWFHNMGMAGINGVNDKKWNVRTLGGMLEELGHTQAVIDILKIDIEYSEWEAFESMFLEGSLANVKQLMFEFHTDEIEKKDSGSKGFTYYWLTWKVLERFGFKYWSYEINPEVHYKSKVTSQDRPCCGNVYFVNANLLVPS